MTVPVDPDLPAAGLGRRLLALVYDAILVTVLLMAGTGLALALHHGHLDVHHPLFRAYLFNLWFFFIAFFWVHRGQTPGMRAWRLRVQRQDGFPIGWTQALLRFLGGLVSAAALGLGYLWVLGPARLAWHDRFSQSRVVVLPPPGRGR